jgi:predicted small integral membrane protein
MKMTVDIPKSTRFRRIGAGLLCALPTAIFANLTAWVAASHLVNLRHFLDSEYIGIFPPNFRYIRSLRSFGIDENTIATIVMGNSVSASLCYAFGLLFLVSATVLLPIRNIKSIKSAPEIKLEFILLCLFFTFLAGFYVYTADFEQSFILYKLSSLRPIASLYLLSFMLFCATILVAASAGLISEKIISKILNSRG